MRQAGKITAVQAALSAVIVALGIVLLIKSVAGRDGGQSMSTALGIVMIVYGIARILILRRV